MPAELAVSVLQVVVPVTTEAIKGLCQWIGRKLEERKERGELVGEWLEEAIEQLSFKISFFTGLSQQGAANDQDQYLALKVWLEKLKETLYDAEDLLDEYATDVAVRETEIDETNSKRFGIAKVSAALKSSFCFKFTAESVVLANRVKKIIGKLDMLEKNAALLDLQKSNVEIKLDRQTTSTPESYPVVGREDEIGRIKEALRLGCGLDTEEKVDTGISSSSNQKPSQLCILPIVGMGGLGKTTLARNVFNDHEMDRLFDLRVWVCVSDNFEKSSILKAIIESIKKEPFQLTRLEELENELRTLVAGKSLLLVLDDIWNDDQVNWELLMTPLQAAAHNARGCAILITSRIVTINRAITGCMKPIHLQGLGERDIRTVFDNYAFRQTTCEEPTGPHNRQTLEILGRDICNKLQGSPLAAKSIGTLLASDHSMEHWKNIAENSLWEAAKRRSDIIPILELSYRYLDASLKHCLSYFSLFPKDYEFTESVIVGLWMAQNVIQQHQGNMQALEDIGIKNIEYLVGRSFLEYEYDGYENRYTMHDLVHDTIQSVSAHDCCLLEDDGGEAKQVHLGVRHLSGFSHVSPQHVYENSSKYKKLRTLMLLDDDADSIKIDPDSMKIDADFLRRVFTHMTCLRVLVLTNCRIKELPESIGNLKLLRLLDLTEYRIGDLVCVPSTMSRLVNLKYLYPDYLPVKRIGRLISLRSDLTFTIRKKSGFGIDQLKCLNALRGTLEIERLDRVQSVEDAKKVHLDKKRHLKSLSLSWNVDKQESVVGEEAVLEALKPCRVLKQISIQNYSGRKPPSWLDDTWLVSLESITLWSVNMEKLPPSLSKMPLLKKLQIKGAPRLEEMRWQSQQPQALGDFSSSSSSAVVLFPMLEDLHIQEMPVCAGWWIEEEEDGKPVYAIFPKLKYMIVENCPKLEDGFVIQAPMLESLEISYVPHRLLNRFQGFPCLKTLRLDTVHTSLVEFIALVPSSGLPSLRELRIEECKNITSCDLPAMTTSLTHVCIQRCYKIISCNLSVSTSLTEVLIQNCPSITSCRLPTAAIQDLTIRNCPQIESLQLSSPSLSIGRLFIDDCPNLVYIGTAPPTDALPSSALSSSKSPAPAGYYCPRRLWIDHCHRKQLCMLLQGINYANLEQLEIGYCEDIEHFNDDVDDGELQLSTALLQLSSLKKLVIMSCKQLKSLPPDMGSRLLSLEEIGLARCPLLTALPDLRPLPALRVLDVRYCHQLCDSPDVASLISSKNLETSVYVN